jgi:plastocyanin
MRYGLKNKLLIVFIFVSIGLSITGCSTQPVVPSSPQRQPAVQPTASTSAPAPSIIPAGSVTPVQQSVTIDLTAEDHAFNLKQISVPAGALVIVNFNNKAQGIPHNFSVYEVLSGGQVRPVFIGNTITGPSNIVYRFNAPSAPGNYFFECDVHPQQMNGPFVVNGQ